MITGKGFSEPANKPLRLFLGYRCDDGHAPVRPSLANDPVPQKDEAVIDVGDMGFLHIQHQFQLAFQKGATFLADFLCLSFGPFYDHDKVVSVSAVRTAGFHCRFSRTVIGRPSLMPKFHAQRSLRALSLRYFASTHASNSWSMLLDKSGEITPLTQKVTCVAWRLATSGARGRSTAVS